MRARIPYLARLAQQSAGQQTAGQATLQPSLPLFAGDSYPPVRRPDRDAGPPLDTQAAASGGWPIPFSPPGDDPGGVHAPRAAERNAYRRGVARAGGDLDVPVVPVPEPTTADAAARPTARTAPAVLPAPPSPPASPAARAVRASTPYASVSRAASRATRAEPAGLVPPAWGEPAGVVPPARGEPAGVVPPARAEVSVAGPRTGPLPAVGPDQVRPPAAWPDALWDGPVDLHMIEQPTARGTGAPVAAAPAPGPVPGGIGGPGPGRDAGGSAAPGVRHQADQANPPEPAEPTEPTEPTGPTGPTSGQLISQAPIASGQLLPRSAPATYPVPVLRPGPSGPSQKPGTAALPEVSIGTIEVTVVPPAPPPPGFPQVQAMRPAPKLAEGTGTGRLREGLRRWYGTAQG